MKGQKVAAHAAAASYALHLLQRSAQPLCEVVEGFAPLGFVGVVPQFGQLGLLPRDPFDSFKGHFDVLGGDLGTVGGDPVGDVLGQVAQRVALAGGGDLRGGEGNRPVRRLDIAKARLGQGLAYDVRPAGFELLQPVQRVVVLKRQMTAPIVVVPLGGWLRSGTNMADPGGDARNSVVYLDEQSSGTKVTAPRRVVTVRLWPSA